MVSTAFPPPALPAWRRSREAGLAAASSPQPHGPAPPCSPCLRHLQRLEVEAGEGLWLILI